MLTEKRAKLRWQNIVLIGALVSLFGASLWSCCIRQATSYTQREEVMAVLAGYEEERNQTAYENSSQKRIAHLSNTAKINVCGKKAKARYNVSYELSQFAFWPIVVELEKDNGSWTVIREKDGRPWWWHIINHTVGVK